MKGVKSDLYANGSSDDDLGSEAAWDQANH
jgi:hypothetical protein